jgi:tRNA-specific 2-thiouridylase
LFVLRLDPVRAEVVVGPRPALARDRFALAEVNWLGDARPAARGERLEVKLRSAMAPVPATVHLDDDEDGNGGGRVVLDEPYPGVAPGQACVFYRGDRLMGGGWIRRDG